jgi:hypothetical protein
MKKTVTKILVALIFAVGTTTLAMAVYSDKLDALLFSEAFDDY